MIEVDRADSSELTNDAGETSTMGADTISPVPITDEQYVALNRSG